MTTSNDLNDVLNLIKIRFRYFEWKLSMFESDEDFNDCFESLQEIIRELNCILNLNTLSSKDRITSTDYLYIVRNIITIESIC
jgi:hypothetical protein